MNEANTKILRKVDDGKAFYFYKAISVYTGEKANSLEEFLQKIKEIGAESLEFHLYREDFEKWITSTIGDARLAKDIEALRVQKVYAQNDLRGRIVVLISKRLKELKSASPLPELKKKEKKKVNA